MVTIKVKYVHIRPSLDALFRRWSIHQVFLPLSSTRDNHMELQVALYKLQLLAQKWSVKSNRSSVTSSWTSALQLAQQELKTQPLKNRDSRVSSPSLSKLSSMDQTAFVIHQFNSSASHSDVHIVILTNQLGDSNISEVQQFTRNHSLNLQVRRIDRP